MDHARKSRRAAGTGWCEEQYSVELARGGSHIASMLSAQSRAGAIAEVVDSFVLRYGETDLAVFLDVLAERLTRRGAPEAAAAVAGVGPRHSSSGSGAKKRQA
jgi:hypothetical protein